MNVTIRQVSALPSNTLKACPKTDNSLLRNITAGELIATAGVIDGAAVGRGGLPLCVRRPVGVVDKDDPELVGGVLTAVVVTVLDDRELQAVRGRGAYPGWNLELLAISVAVGVIICCRGV